MYNFHPTFYILNSTFYIRLSCRLRQQDKLMSFGGEGANGLAHIYGDTAFAAVKRNA